MKNELEIPIGDEQEPKKKGRDNLLFDLKDLRPALKDLAARMRTTMTGIIRRAVVEFINREEKKEG